jgi:DNA-binding transcriptional MocR family regulator
MHETAIMAPPLNAAVVTEWVHTRVFHKLIDEVRSEARLRQEIARDCLTPARSARRITVITSGWTFRTIWTAATLRCAAPTRPACHSGDAFAADRSLAGPAAMRVSIGGTIAREQLRRGLNLLSALISPQAPRKVSLV